MVSNGFIFKLSLFYASLKLEELSNRNYLQKKKQYLTSQQTPESHKLKTKYNIVKIFQFINFVHLTIIYRESSRTLILIFGLQIYLLSTFCFYHIARARQLIKPYNYTLI